MRYSNFILFVLFLIGSRAFALDVIRVNTMNDRDGLSQNTVRCMMQDSRGFMWLGTINGLNRYDGREFITVQPRPDFPQTLRDNRISSIGEDSNGYIWVHTFSDMLLCYNPRLGVFIDYAPENKTKIFPNIKMASNGDVWLWGDQGICRVRHEKGKLHSWTPNTQALTQ
jgi:ligand-binding sensor domain-containing protein